MSHDHNFKNLILDYPHQAIAFFAAVEAQAVDAGARILPIREEQLKERLGDRFRELDVPLLVEWPDGPLLGLTLIRVSPATLDNAVPPVAGWWG